MTRGGSGQSGEVGDTTSKWEKKFGVSTFRQAGNATTRGLDTVSSGGSPTEESPHTSIDVSSKRPRPWCLITPTGEKDHVVDEHDFVVSDYMSDMEEECGLRAATLPDVSLSEGVAVQQNPSQEGPRNSPGPYRCV